METEPTQPETVEEIFEKALSNMRDAQLKQDLLNISEIARALNATTRPLLELLGVPSLLEQSGQKWVDRSPSGNYFKEIEMVDAELDGSRLIKTLKAAASLQLSLAEAAVSTTHELLASLPLPTEPCMEGEDVPLTQDPQESGAFEYERPRG